MSRTVSLPLALAVIVLVLVGGVTTGYVLQRPATDCPTDGSYTLLVSPGPSPSSDPVNASALPSAQRAVFLLAVDVGSFSTPDSGLESAMRRLPEHVRYEGQTYAVTITVAN